MAERLSCAMNQGRHYNFFVTKLKSRFCGTADKVCLNADHCSGQRQHNLAIHASNRENTDKKPTRPTQPRRNAASPRFST